MSDCYAVTINDLLLDRAAGPDVDGVCWVPQDVHGWWLPPAVRQNAIDRSAMDGQVMAASFYQNRHISLEGLVYSDANEVPYQAMQALSDALNLGRDPGALSVDDGTQVLTAEVYLAGEASLAIRGGGVVTFQAPLVAMDPRKYAATPDQHVITLTGTATADTDVIAAAGSIDTAPTIAITGPAVNPRIANATDGGRFVRFLRTIAGGETLTLDFARRTAIVTPGSIDVYADIDPGSSWWVLLSGNNSVTYSRDSGAATSTATIDWSDAYI